MDAFKYQNKLAFLTFLLAVFCFAYSSQDKFHIRIPEPVVLNLRKVAVDCEQQTGVPASHLKKIVDQTLPNDRPNKEFFLCITTGSGFVDKDGHANLEKLKEFHVNQTREDFDNYFRECNKNVKDDSVETLSAVANCVYAEYIITADSPLP